MYHFRVTLRDVTNPQVWRYVVVPSDFTFEMFHKVLQIVFGWLDYHLYEFTDRQDCFDQAEFRITIPSEYDDEYDEKTYDARRKKLSSVFPKRKSLTYIYDYGDYWNFEIRLERTSRADESPYARCLDGGGATPPEDCGGAEGYKMMKQSLDGKDTESASYREWLGLRPDEKWDPDFFPTQLKRYIDIALAELFR